MLRALLLLLLTSIVATGCHKAPSRAEALEAFRAARPGVDSGAAYVRIWADGPPWFSCAEVLAKIPKATDHAIIRDQLRPWRSLVVANWITLRDTAARNVVDPGWCSATLHDEAKRIADGWRAVQGDSIPSGGLRRGWDVLVGARRVAVARKLTLVGRDSARARYIVTIVPNENGVATGAERDSVVREGLLEKVDGRWRLVRMEDLH